MKKNPILGIKNQDNIAHFLKDEFRVVKPYIYYKNGELVKNFDIFLNFDGTLSDTKMLQKHNIPMFGHRRMGKYEQMLVARKHGVTTPDTFRVVLDDELGARKDTMYALLRDVPNDEAVILKSEDGARGIGQALVTKDQLYKLIDMCHNDNVETDDILEKFEIGAKGSFKSDAEKEYFRGCIIHNNYIIQRRVQMVAEWRYVHFYGQEPMIVQRDVKANWQANTSITGKGKNIPFDLENEVHMKMKDIADKIAEDLGTPFLSMDFYLDKNDNVGLFEYQMQLGYAIMPKSHLVESTIQACHAWLHDFYKPGKKQ